MNEGFDFERLVELCQRTHEETRRSAVRAIDRSLVVRNWLFGWYIVEYEQSGADRAEYGAQTLKRLSAALKERIGRGFSVRSLEQFRRFFLQFNETMPHAGKSQTVSPISATARIPQTPSAKSGVSGQGLSEMLQQFLLELGKGFLFEARQKRLSFDDSHFFLDLVFYNRLLRCYVLIDFKTGKLTHQDLGQMQMYVNYFDRFVRTDDELPTVGILLCDQKNDAVVELTLPEDANIYASKYQLYLPSKQELAEQLSRVRREIEGHTEFLERADALAATTSGAKQTDSTILIREDRGR